MQTNQERQANLPLKGNLSLIYILCIIIAGLMAAASLAGLFRQTITYPSDELVRTFLPTDVSLLFIGLPMLLGSMWLTWRGKLIGLLFWPGALFFILYNYLVYVLAMPLSLAFLLHLTLVTTSVYGLISLLASIDPQAVQRQLKGAVPERLAGGILIGLGLVFFLRAMGIMVSTLRGQASLNNIDFSLNTVDYLVAPTWVICGSFLWRRQAFGYVTALGLLFQGSMLFVGLVVFLLLQPYLTQTPFALLDALVVLALGLICFIPLALYVRGVASA